MIDFSRAIEIIKKYEGFSEKAYPDPVTGDGPYTFGYGTQYYPDGSPVKQGQCCTERKALEYLYHEISVIDAQLVKLNLGLDDSMQNALVSFIHSIGWDPFLYTTIIDFIEVENWAGVVADINRWIFDSHYKIIGGLVDRRREEAALFLTQIKKTVREPGGILLDAFRNYSGRPYEIDAIRMLETSCNPYVLAEFANSFHGLEKDLTFESELEEPMFEEWD